jgi:peptidoglycan lytic transglycosylase
MKWNISLGAALSLILAACGGGRSHADYGLETSASGDSPAVQAWGGAGGKPASEPVPQLEPVFQDNGRPGAAYAPPGEPPRQLVERLPAPIAQDQADPADPAAGAIGPSGSSRQAPSRYDEVGYAGIRPAAGAEGAAVAVHRSLPAGSYAEVTSLDTGRTILVLITGALSPDADRPIDLSAGAARQLGVESQATAAVRVRRVNPTAFDQAALNQGQPAAPRPDTPPVLLTALRKHLPGRIAAAPPSTRPAAPLRTAPTRHVPLSRGYFVQVAALSNAGNAQSLAQSMNGFVKPGGGLYRVQIGPFATRGQADAARKRAAGAGYGDARVFAN